MSEIRNFATASFDEAMRAIGELKSFKAPRVEAPLVELYHDDYELIEEIYGYVGARP